MLANVRLALAKGKGRAAMIDAESSGSLVRNQYEKGAHLLSAPLFVNPT
jgi:hypothetical protein